MNYPLISLVICTYNGERYLEKTLDSVVEQSYPNMEIVVIDDGSSDSTVSIINSYALHDDRFRVFVIKNGGLPAARNFAFTQARGEWIAIIDQDDLCYPERLSKQMAIAQKYPSAGLVFCDTDYIDSDGKIIGHHFSSFALPDAFIPRKVAGNLLLSAGCYIASAACFISRKVISTIGPLDESLRYACDYDYFIRCGMIFDLAYTNEKLAAWRIHESQQSTVNMNRFKEYRSVLVRYFLHNSVTMDSKFEIVFNLLRSFAGQVYKILRGKYLVE